MVRIADLSTSRANLGLLMQIHVEITGIYRVSIFTTSIKKFKECKFIIYMKLYSPKAWSYQARGQEEPIGNHKHAFILIVFYIT